jgi:hypothetical protein
MSLKGPLAITQCNATDSSIFQTARPIATGDDSRRMMTLSLALHWVNAVPVIAQLVLA